MNKLKLTDPLLNKNCYINENIIFSDTIEGLKEKVDFIEGTRIIETIDLEGDTFYKYETIIDDRIKGQFYLKKGEEINKKHLVYREVSDLKKYGENIILYIGKDNTDISDRNSSKLSIYGEGIGEIYFKEIKNIVVEGDQIFYDAVAHYYDGYEGRTYGANFLGIEFGKGFIYDFNHLPRWNTRGDSGPESKDAKKYFKNNNITKIT